MDQFISEGILRRLIRLPYLPLYVNVMDAAVRLDLFSGLTDGKTAQALAVERGWDKDNTRYFLDALFCLGFLWKRDGRYQNCRETDRYLVKGKPEYIGGLLAFNGVDGSFGSQDIKQLLEDGPCTGEKRPELYGDGTKESGPAFEEYVEGMRESQRGYRQTEILRIVKGLPEYPGIRKVLDLGCATGLLGLAVIGSRPDMRGVLYDMPLMEPVIRESARLAGLEDRAVPMVGDYLRDGIGQDYDLILAIATLSFAGNGLGPLMKKLYGAMNPGGVLVCFSEGIERDFSEPWDMILGWLPCRMQGEDMGIKKNEIVEAALSHGFKSAERISGAFSTGTIDLDIIRK